jgi:hypothetical protein
MSLLIFNFRVGPNPTVHNNRVTNLINDLVTDLPHLGRTRIAPIPFDSLWRTKFTKKRPLDALDADATMRFRG